jgi:ankyrin repeat protein
MHTPFHSAATNDAAGIRKLRQLGVDLDQKDHCGRSGIHIAALHGHLETVVEFLRAGVAIDSLDRQGLTPFGIAAKTFRHKISHALTAESNLREKFYRAVYEGFDAAVLYHCNLMDPNLEMTFGLGYTALHVAAYRGHAAVVRTLILAGADLETTSQCGDSPMSCAAHQGHTAVVEALLWTLPHHDGLPKLRNTGMALYLAAQSGFKDIVGILVDEGCCLEFVDPGTGNTALLIAAHQGHAAVVSLLLYHGADITATNSKRISALDFAMANKHTSTVAVLSRPPTNWQFHGRGELKKPACFISLARYV